MPNKALLRQVMRERGELRERNLAIVAAAACHLHGTSGDAVRQCRRMAELRERIVDEMQMNAILSRGQAIQFENERTPGRHVVGDQSVPKRPMRTQNPSERSQLRVVS